MSETSQFIKSSDGTVWEAATVNATTAPGLQLDGVNLLSIEIDFRTGLKFDETTISIGTPFLLTVEGQPHALDPEARATLGPLLAVYPATGSSATIGANLTLRLVFTSGAVIEVPEDPAFEAWVINGPGSRIIVCPPRVVQGLRSDADERACPPTAPSRGLDRSCLTARSDVGPSLACNQLMTSPLLSLVKRL